MRRTAVEEYLRRLVPCSIVARLTLEQMQQAGLHSGRVTGDGREFVEYAPYVPGDDVRSIDWRLFGRSDRLFCRHARVEQRLGIILWLDASASMDYAGAGAPCSKFRFGAMLALVLALLASRNGERISLALDGGSENCTWLPNCTVGELGERLDECMPGGQCRTPELTGVLGGFMRSGTVLFLISDCLNEQPFLPEFLSAVAGRGGECRILQVVDNDELTLPFDSGEAAFADPESGETVYADPARVRAQYCARMERRLAEIHAQCLGRRVFHRIFNTGEDPVAGLLEAVNCRTSQGAYLP